jgi:superfamily II DNA or RNA helicase
MPSNGASFWVVPTSMGVVAVAKMNDVYLWVSGEPYILREMSDYFTFSIPNAKFHPSYRMGVWDGKIRLLNYKDGTIYAGLISHIKTFCHERGYKLQYEEEGDENFSLNEANEFIEPLGLPFKPRDYQVEAFVAAVRKKRMLLLSPTGSGKSLIIYLLIRLYLTRHDRKHLIIVPSTSLVAQMKKDFESYGLEGSMVHQIMSGRDKQTDKPIVISTWQSLYKMPKSYFDQFGTVVVDECHGVKAKSITNIMTKMTNTPYRFGTTGTLDGTLTNKLVIEGLLGEVRKVTATANLIEEKVLADFMVKSIILKHQKKVPANLKYQEEIDYLVSNESRNKFIKNLVLSLKGNTLVLFTYVEKHGVPLFELINNARETHRKCFFVYGGTELDTREKVRAVVEKEDNAIIIASSGVYSQGINIRRLHNVVFTHPGKSRIRTLQSIGRALRRVDDEEAVLYDIVDDLTNGRKTRNYSLKHYQERFMIYKSEKFKVKTYNVKLKG